MTKLFKTEHHKLLPYRTFWVISALYLLLLPLAFYMGTQITFNVNGVGSDQIGIEKIYHFPYNWHNLTYLASYFNIIIGVFMIIHVSNEFSYRTWRQHIIDGLSRAEVVGGKYVTALFLSVVMALYSGIIVLIFGAIYTPESSSVSMFQNASHIVAYGIQAFGYLSLAILAGVLLQRSGLAIVLFILYVLIIENIIAVLVPANVAEWLPVATIQDMVPFPFSTPAENANVRSFEDLMANQNSQLFQANFWAGLGYSIVFGVIATGILTKKDL